MAEVAVGSASQKSHSTVFQISNFKSEFYDFVKLERSSTYIYLSTFCLLGMLFGYYWHIDYIFHKNMAYGGSEEDSDELDYEEDEPDSKMMDYHPYSGGNNPKQTRQ